MNTCEFNVSVMAILGCADGSESKCAMNYFTLSDEHDKLALTERLKVFRDVSDRRREYQHSEYENVKLHAGNVKEVKDSTPEKSRRADDSLPNRTSISAISIPLGVKEEVVDNYGDVIEVKTGHIGDASFQNDEDFPMQEMMSDDDDLPDVPGSASMPINSTYTVRDSAETALKEDAPHLLQALAENGISLDYMRLFDGDMDNFSPCDRLAGLRDVLNKIFSRLNLAHHPQKKGSKASYYLGCLTALIGQAHSRKYPAEWGWCGALHSFIFVFKRHHRVVVERPQFGCATYFFELVDSHPVPYQIVRLITVMKFLDCRRPSMIDNPSIMVAADPCDEEATVLKRFGWVLHSSVGTLVNYRDRLSHDRKPDPPGSDQRSKVLEMLAVGYSSGSIVSSAAVECRHDGMTDANRSDDGCSIPLLVMKKDEGFSFDDVGPPSPPHGVVPPSPVRRFRKGRKRTATGCVETALEEDAPALLQALIEQGVSFDEMMLYDHDDDHDDDDDGCSCFNELEDVISQVFSGQASLVKLLDQKCERGGRSGYYYLVCLFALLEQMRMVRLWKWPVEWGWCRDLRSFIFVFVKHNRIVLERPEYGYATYFFELVGSSPIKWQIRRLVIVMKFNSGCRLSLLEDRPLIVGEDLSREEAVVLKKYGWVEDGGIRTLVNYRDRVVHDWKNSGSVEWRSKIAKLLADGHTRGTVVSL